MRVVPVKVFCRHISPLLEKCPDFVIEQEVVKVVASACRDTGCLTTTSEFKTTAGKEDYEIPLPDGLDVEKVRFCYCDGLQLRPVTYNTVTGRSFADWREFTGAPQYYSFRQHGEFCLLPKPDKEYTIRVDLTATLKPRADVVPEFFYDSYLDLVTYGVLARAHRIFGQPFSNIELATAYETKYNMEISRLKGDAFSDFTRTTGRLRFNRILF